MKTQIIFIMIFLISACKPTINKDIQDVLKASGKNKSELEKVIDYYGQNPEDSIKYRAACFLIENMVNKFGFYPDLEKAAYYDAIFDDLRRMYEAKKSVDTIKYLIQNKYKEMKNRVGEISYQVIPDYEVITADLLIGNIEYSFKVWQEMPWCNHLNFDQFCESVLPYRFSNEPLQIHKKVFFEEYQWLKDSLKDSDNPRVAFNMLYLCLSEKFNFSDKLDPYPLRGAIDMYSLNGGSCKHMNLIIASVMRSMGIPVLHEQTPQYAGLPGHHDWLAIIDKNGEVVPFKVGDKVVELPANRIPPVNNGKVTKVYRETFKNGHNILPEEISSSMIPDAFSLSDILDVTSEYDLSRKKLKFDLINKYPGKVKYVFLCTFELGEKTIPLAYSRKDRNTVEFDDVGHNSIYFPAYYLNGKAIPLANPILLDNNGEISKLEPDLDSTICLSLYRKFPANIRVRGFARFLFGARFQGSDDSLFLKSEVLFEKDRKDFDVDYMIRKVNCNNSFRYYRFLPFKSLKVGLAELKFVASENEIPIRFFGDPVQNDPGFNSEVQKAFDGDISTNTNLPGHTWIAVDFGHPVMLKQIEYLVRNDLNVVEAGKIYELKYFDLGWQSLGKQVATENSLYYDNIPQNAVLLLKCLSGGYEERIFTLRKGILNWL